MDDYILVTELGDNILLGPQTIGKLVAKPDPETFLVHSESIPGIQDFATYFQRGNVYFFPTINNNQTIMIIIIIIIRIIIIIIIKQ